MLASNSLQSWTLMGKPWMHLDDDSNPQSSHESVGIITGSHANLHKHTVKNTWSEDDWQVFSVHLPLSLRVPRWICRTLIYVALGAAWMKCSLIALHPNGCTHLKKHKCHRQTFTLTQVCTPFTRINRKIQMVATLLLSSSLRENGCQEQCIKKESDRGVALKDVFHMLSSNSCCLISPIGMCLV